MNRNWTIIGAVMGAVLLVGGGGAHRSLLADRAQRLEELQQQVQALRTRSLAAIDRKRAPQLEARINAPFQRDVGALLHMLTETLDELRVQQESITMEAAREVSFIREVPIQVTYRGSFASVFEIGQRLYRQYPITRLESLRVARDDEATDHNTLSVVMRLLVYQRPTGEGG